MRKRSIYFMVFLVLVTVPVYGTCLHIWDDENEPLSIPLNSLNTFLDKNKEHLISLKNKGYFTEKNGSVDDETKEILNKILKSETNITIYFKRTPEHLLKDCFTLYKYLKDKVKNDPDHDYKNINWKQWFNYVNVLGRILKHRYESEEK